MQSRSPFQGGPVSGLVFPTEQYVGAVGQSSRDYANAAAKASETYSKGMQELGKGIGSAIGSIAGAYEQNKTAEKDFKANNALLDSEFYQKIIGTDSEGA